MAVTENGITTYSSKEMHQSAVARLKTYRGHDHYGDPQRLKMVDWGIRIRKDESSVMWVRGICSACHYQFTLDEAL